MNRYFEENVYDFIAELKQFDYTIESADQIWNVIFPHKTVRLTSYHYIRVTKYRDIFYIGLINGKLCSLQIQKNKSVQAVLSFGSSPKDDNLARVWNGLISSARYWLKIVKKDWIKANKQVWLSFPLNNRYGIVCNTLIRELVPDMYRIDHKLGKTKTRKFIKLVEQGNVRW